ncbi:DUF1232 domain-containing protein [bacterium]|nr:DUF1232 domain-containing protein [bacterium]
MKKYKTNFSKEELHEALYANANDAIAIIEDENKWMKFKEKFEIFIKKAKKIPVLGRMIDDIVCMVSLVDSYVKKEYKDIPVATIISIVAALIYLLSPIDIIPDMIPIIGYLDDVAVLLFILNFGVDKDLEKYRLWQKSNRKLALDNFERILAEELSEIINDGYLAAIVLCDDNIIKMLIVGDQNAEIPVDCIIKEVNVPVRALAEYDMEEEKSIIAVIDETIIQESIRWMNGAEKKAYIEPEFEEKWNDYVIQGE